MKAKIQLLVTVSVDGGYYCDADDLAQHVDGWIQSALDDRDDIDAYGDGLSITRVNSVPEPQTARYLSLQPAERKYLLDAARGYTAQRIASRHLVSVHTVNASLKTAKYKLRAHNTAHAVAKALKVGEFTTSDLKEGN